MLGWVVGAVAMAMAVSGFAQPYTYYIAATTANGGVSGSQGDDTRTLVQARSPATPWATITKWKTTVFDAGLMNVGDQVVISGLIREPDGVVLNAISYAWGSRYMKGFRQWLPSDGFPGTPGTQTLAANNIQRARITSAQVLTGTSIVDTSGVGTINPTNTGLTSDQIEYLTWRYYDNIDRHGRHFGHRLYATAASGSIVAGDGRYKFNGTTLTMDLTGADTTVGNWEICKRIGAILQFQNWQGFGKDGPALVDGITFDRAVNIPSGAYAVSMENCYQTVIRNCVAYDAGHHTWGITGSSNDGCVIQNVVAMGQYGINTSDGGGQGGNSMTASASTAQTGFTWNATNQTLTRAGGYLNNQQPVQPGAIIVISSGTGTSAGQTVLVDYSVSATSFRVRTPITATDGATDIAFTINNICRNHRVEKFDYHMYPPLSLTVTNHVASATRQTRPIGLNNAAPAGSTDCVYTNNVYSGGRVVYYPDTMPASPSVMQNVSAGGRRTGWTTNVWDPAAYPLLIEDVEFIDCAQQYSSDHQDVAYSRCTFNFMPSVRTVDGTGSGAIVVQSSNSGADVAATRILFSGCELLFDLGGSGATSSVAFSAPAIGNNQTGWTLTAPSTLTKGGGLSNCPIPRPGTIISTTSGTGVTAAPYTVVSATATTIVVAETIVGTNGAADIAFDVCMAEIRAVDSTFVAGGLRRGATVTSARMFNCANTGTQGRYRGALYDFRSCIIGFDRLVTGITNVLFISDQTYSDGKAFGDRRVMSGNVYLNISTNEFSDVTGSLFNSSTLFTRASDGVDRTGVADNSNVVMNPAWSSAVFPRAYPVLTPPLSTAPFAPAGVNRARNLGAPGAWQFGTTIDRPLDLRGRSR